VALILNAFSRAGILDPPLFSAMSLVVQSYLAEKPSSLPSSDMSPQVPFVFFFFTLDTGPRRSLSLDLSDTRVCEPQTRARVPPSSGECIFLSESSDEVTARFGVTTNIEAFVIPG